MRSRFFLEDFDKKLFIGDRLIQIWPKLEAMEPCSLV